MASTAFSAAQAAKAHLAHVPSKATRVVTLGKGAPPYQSRWKRVDAVPLTRVNFLDLLHGRTPTIREAGFLTPEECFAHEKELSPNLAPYKHNTGPLLKRVGVAQFEYQAQTALDFQNRSNGMQNPVWTPPEEDGKGYFL